jgi:hypothetical protein
MFRGDLRAAAAALLQDGISRDESDGVTAVDLEEISDLRALCESVSAQWRQLQLASVDNSVNNGEKLSEVAPFSMFWREYFRISSTVIATRARTLAALFVKKEIVNQLVKIEGCFETSSFLMASFCDDFDRWIAGGTTIAAGCHYIVEKSDKWPSTAACALDVHLLDECGEFWALWMSWEKVFGDIENCEASGSDNSVREAHATLATRWPVLEAKVASLACRAAMTVAGLVAKRKVLTVCLAFAGGVRNTPLLSDSFLADFDRIISADLAAFRGPPPDDNQV